jgi:hypothetical protein
MRNFMVRTLVTFDISKNVLVEDEAELDELFDAWTSTPDQYDGYHDDVVETVTKVEIIDWVETALPGEDN